MESGALMSYGPDLPAIFRHAAVYVDKILEGKRRNQPTCPSNSPRSSNLS
jgi:hypothetical protein